MSGRAVTCLVLALAIGHANAKSYKCSVINEAGFCFVENVVIDGPPVAVEFPKHPTLLIKSGTIRNFTKDVYGLLGETRQLHMYNNTRIERLTIVRSNLAELNVQRNGLLEFDVEPAENRELKTLTIVHNAITGVPRNIRFLVGLEKLYLYNNSLEYLDLETLSNATALKILSLYDNRIKTLDSKLGLRFGNLQTLSLSKNKLTFVPYFFDAFPGLSAISLRKNPWNCQWLRAVMTHVERQTIQIVRKDAACRDRLINDICCYRTVLDFLFESQSIDLLQKVASGDGGKRTAEAYDPINSTDNGALNGF